MPTDTTETALEACIERYLTGEASTPTSNDGKVKEEPGIYGTGKGIGYVRGKSSDYNAEFAIDEAKFWQFLESTQGDGLAKLHYKPDFKRQVVEKDKDQLDELLESVDLSTYGLERVRLNQHIELEDEETELEAENPNVRGVYNPPPEESPLDEIIRTFNERFFDAWDATPEEQRVKLIKILEHVKGSDGYQAQVVDNADEQNRRIALEALISDAVNKERRRELELYKLYAGDSDFKRSLNESLIRILAIEEEKGKSA